MCWQLCIKTVKFGPKRVLNSVHCKPTLIGGAGHLVKDWYVLLTFHFQLAFPRYIFIQNRNCLLNYTWTWKECQRPQNYNFNFKIQSLDVENDKSQRIKKRDSKRSDDWVVSVVGNFVEKRIFRYYTGLTRNWKFGQIWHFQFGQFPICYFPCRISRPGPTM